MNKEFLMEVKFKNNKLLQKMREYGHTTAASLHRACGVNQSIIGSFLNLKITPFKKDGEPTAATEKLCKYFRCLPEDLFPKEQMVKALETNKVEIELTAPQIEGIMHPESLTSEELLDKKELSVAIMKSIDKINEFGTHGSDFSLKDIIVRRFGLEGFSQMTLGEIADEFGVTPEAIRFREARALRMLRHPANNKDVEEFLDNDVQERVRRNRKNWEDRERAKKIQEEYYKMIKNKTGYYTIP